MSDNGLLYIQEEQLIQDVARVIKALASKLLDQGMPVERISHLTNLPRYEVESLGQHAFVGE